MAYDYTGAIQAGANPDDVLNYLGTQNNYDVQGALKAGANRADLLSYLSAQPTASQALNNTQASSPTEDTGSFFGNVVKSAKNLGSNLLNVVAHPIDTLTGIAKTGIGAVEEAGNVITGTQNTPENADTNTQAFDNLIHFFGQRYGGSNAEEVGTNIAHTAYTDPVGFLADLSAVFSGGASVAGSVAKAGEIAGIGGDVARIAQAGLETSGSVTNPITMIAKPIGAISDATGLSTKLGSAYDAIKAKLSQPFAVNTNTDLIDAAKNIGLKEEDLTASMVNNNPAVNLAETFAAKGAGAATFAEKFDNLNQQLQDIKTKTLEEAGNAQDLSSTGKNIAKGMQDYQDAYRKQTGALYDAFGKIGNNLPAEVNTTTDALHSIISKLEGIGENADFFNKKLEVITGGETAKTSFKSPTFQTLKDLRTNIGEKLAAKFLDPFVKTNEGYLKQLYGTLTSDMNETVKASGNVELATKLQNAESTFKAGLKELNTGYAKPLMVFLAKHILSKMYRKFVK
jgi:uncharacterized protein YukE